MREGREMLNICLLGQVFLAEFFSILPSGELIVLGGWGEDGYSTKLYIPTVN